MRTAFIAIGRQVLRYLKQLKAKRVIRKVSKVELLECLNEPKDVVRTLKALSELKGVSEAEVADKTSANAVRFFGLK